jgi:pimeloyl-ACP methyl ester carboxylesterase
MEYEIYGDSENEMIVFIHGIGASSWMWWQQIGAFSDHYQVCLADLPGHGRNAAIPWIDLATTARLIAEDVIGNRNAHLIGISLGGHVALELAKQYPRHVKSTLISGITVKPIPFKFLMPIQSRLVQFSLKNTERLVRFARENYSLPDHKINEFVRNYQLLTRENYEAIGKEIMDFQLNESYAGITSPILFAAGSKESNGILDSLHAAPEIIEGAKSKKIPGAAHVWPVNMPEEFNQLVKEWLTKL